MRRADSGGKSGPRALFLRGASAAETALVAGRRGTGPDSSSAWSRRLVASERSSRGKGRASCCEGELHLPVHRPSRAPLFSLSIFGDSGERVHEQRNVARFAQGPEQAAAIPERPGPS
ncbi:hypothetical protein MRX96_000256 [Rhipicephalus microplus]